MKKQKGFTLVEFLIVVVIIGIMVGTVFSSLKAATPSAKEIRVFSHYFGVDLTPYADMSKEPGERLTPDQKGFLQPRVARMLPAWGDCAIGKSTLESLGIDRSALLALPPTTYPDEIQRRLAELDDLDKTMLMKKHIYAQIEAECKTRETEARESAANFGLLLK